MHPRRIDQTIAELGARQHGHFLAAQAVELGIDNDSLRHRVRQGWLLRSCRGLYRLRDHPLTWHGHAQAALLLAGAGAVLSHGTAARLHGLWAYRDHPHFDVTAPESTNQRQRLGRLHVSSWMDEDHVTSIDGLNVTTVARTFFDLAGDVEPRLRSPAGRLVHEQRMHRVLNDALRSRGLTLIHETAVLASLAKRGRSGTALVRSLLEEAGPAYEPTDSDGEALFLELVRAADLVTPRMHVLVADGEGFIGEVDFFFEPDLVVEIDGRTHSGHLDIAEDRRRDERLRRIGLRVMRVTYARDLLGRPATVMSRLRIALDRSKPL